MTKANSEEINKRIDQVMTNIRPGDYAIISKMINGVYKPRTVRAMLKKERTMNLGVLQTAETLISTIDNLINSINKDENTNC